MHRQGALSGRFLMGATLVTGMLLGVSRAAAAPITYEAYLDGISESPPNASPGTGYATATIDAVAHTMRVTVEFTGLLGTTTASHIHVINGPGDTDNMDTLGPVATTTPTFTGFPLGVTSGTYDHTYDMTQTSSYNPSWITANGGVVAQAEAALFAGIAGGRAYLNLHTNIFPGGEIRSFFQPIPEPSSAALALCGAVVLWGVRRRRGT